MSSGLDKAIKDLIQIIQEASNKGTSPLDAQAEVLRIDEDGTAWVHFPGGVDETPVKLTIAAHNGDIVNVRSSGGKAWITGNETAPPTDDTTAIVARTAAHYAQATADDAKSVADEALEDASRAKSAADSAESSAVSAQASANAAGESASRAQAAAQAAVDEVEEQQEYFWHDSLGAHVLSDTDDVTGVRYRTDIKGAGQEIFKLNTDGTESSVSKFGETVRLGMESGNHMNLDSDSIDFMDGTTQIGYVGADSAKFPIMHVSSRMSIGNKYEWRTTPSGSLGLYLM